jgi:hypothetical protein
MNAVRSFWQSATLIRSKTLTFWRLAAIPSLGTDAMSDTVQLKYSNADMMTFSCLCCPRTVQQEICVKHCPFHNRPCTINWKCSNDFEQLSILYWITQCYYLLLTTYKSTHWHNPEDYRMYLHCHDSLIHI